MAYLGWGGSPARLEPTTNLIDPVQVVGDLNVHAGHIRLATANAPRHDTNHLPDAVPFANQRTTTIALARILALLTAGTDEALVQVVRVAEARLAQLVLALVVIHNRHVHLLQDVLILAIVTERVLTPAGGPATLAGEIGMLVGQTGGRDVGRTGKIHRTIHLQNGQIVVKRAGVIFRVYLHRDDIALNVRVEFDVVVYVPFAESYTKIESIVAVMKEVLALKYDTTLGRHIIYLRFHTVSRRYDVQIVDQGTTAHVHRFLGILLQNCHLPWVFAELAITVHVHRVLDASVNALRVSYTTLAQILARWIAIHGLTAANLTTAALLLLLTRARSVVRLSLWNL